MDLLLGIDIGTSACKAVVFNKNGEAIASAKKEYDVYYKNENWAEQNPNEWWTAVIECIREILFNSSIEPNHIKAIGVDGQSWSAIPIDKEGNVLYNTPIWMDTRSAQICDDIKEKIDENQIFNLCGNLFEPTYTTPKILWIAKNKPEIYKKTYKILQSNSFIVYRLTNIITQDISQGYGLHFFDMKNGIWDSEMCKKLGIDINLMPTKISKCHEIVGCVTDGAAKLTGLTIGTPVVAGGLDAACSTLGAGVIHEGQTQEQGGQAGGMSICLNECKTHKKLIMSHHVVPNRWLLQGGTVGGGGVLKWLKNEFYKYSKKDTINIDEDIFNKMNNDAEAVSKGCDGVVFLPYMAGERSPIWDKEAKGVFFGLDFKKTKAHFTRACFEGVAYALKHNLDTAEDSGVSAEKLHATGGSVNSILWTQIKADVTGREILVTSSDNSTALGAAILAGVGVGIYNNFEDAVKKCVRIEREHIPNLNNKKYLSNYATYLSLYDNLKELMHK